jgi:hypothetical protein
MPTNDKRRLAEILARELGDDDTVADETDTALFIAVKNWVIHLLEVLQ